VADVKPKRIRLALVNAAEDVPRVVRAYGRTAYGEVAMVLRPPEGRGVMVLVTKKDGAFSWRASDDSDAPAPPAEALTPKEAVDLVKAEQKGVPKAGPITLRGQWRGWLICDGGQPRVELERKLATYGVLRIASRTDGVWTWTVERTERWFSRPGDDTGDAETLVRAIEAGLARAMGLLGEACSMRDSRRRAAFDRDYAERHPIRAAREGKNPTERLRAKRSQKKVTLQAGDRAALVSDATRVGTVIEWRGEERIVWQEDGERIRAVFAPAMLVPVKAAAKKAAAKRPAAKKLARKAVRTPRKKKEPAVDAAQDKALLDAFSAAVAAAMGGP